MKITGIIQVCKNIFAIKMMLIVLNFSVQDLEKDCGNSLFYV